MNRELNVYLCGKKTGVLSENEQLQLTFRYSGDRMQPLSVHLPVRIEEYAGEYTFPYFENLTPEGEAFEILTRDHVAGNKIFSFLDRFGGDCAGAVSFYKTKPAKKRDEKLHVITAKKVSQIIDRLPDDPLLTSLENPPRLSIAGAQSKFAVYKSGGKYYRSDDDYPTTHIIKIANRRFPNLLNNELFCMKLARNMELDVPAAEIKTAGRSGASAKIFLEIERYDRMKTGSAVRRVHQEDFCQALGIVSDLKYQAGGGASLRDCFRVLEKFSCNLLTDINRFAEWIVFNYLVGNTDAHAKNLALLHTGSGIRLAPFYDLLSTEIYPVKTVDHGMAMLINGKGKYDSLGPKDFAALFGQLGLNAINMMKILGSRFGDIVSAAENLRDELIDAGTPQEEGSYSCIYDNIIKLIKKRHTRLFSRSP